MSVSNNSPQPQTPAFVAERKFSKARPLAKRVGVHPKTLFRWAEQGLISRFKISQRVVVFDEAEVDRLIQDAKV